MLSKEVITQWNNFKEKILSGQKRKLSVEEMDFFDKLSFELNSLSFRYQKSSTEKEDLVWFMSMIKENFPKLEKKHQELLKISNALFTPEREFNDASDNLSITYMGYADILGTYERLLKLWGDYDYEEVKSLKIEGSRLRDLIREQDLETLKATRLVRNSSGFLQLQFLATSPIWNLSEQEREKLRDLESKIVALENIKRYSRSI